MVNFYWLTHSTVKMTRELKSEEIRAAFETGKMQCKTTADISPLDEIIGQGRALRAMKFGFEIDEKGFNIYAAGQPGTGKTTTVKAYLEEVAESRLPPFDWCYVHNFKTPAEPNAIRLPQAHAIEFKKDIGNLIDNVKKVLPEIFQSEDYANRKKAALESAEKQRNDLFAEISKKATKKGFALQSSPSGLLVVPTLEGQPLDQKEFAALSPDALAKITKAREELEDELRNTMHELREIDSKAKEALEELNRKVALYAIDHFVDYLKEKYSKIDEVVKYLESIQGDILDNLDAFVTDSDAEPPSQEAAIAIIQFFRKYEVNVLVNNEGVSGAPVIVEPNPTHLNLFGRAEKEARFGVLTTDFTLIRPGSLHKANGGYLIIPIQELLAAPYAYDSLKRALKNEEITIEDAEESSGVLTARGLKPEPMKLKVKVVLIGNPELYDLLYTKDPDFRELFKVKAHFDTSMDRNDENIAKYCAAITSVCEKEGLKHLDTEAIAKVIEYSSRLAEDQSKVSTKFSDVADIIREATFYAEKENVEYVTGSHVAKAIEEKIYRSNLVQEKIQEMISRNMILIDTEGEKVGQLNGLAVISYGDVSFGGPSRITASVGVGRQGIVDIEREANLGGPIHTKGVMILGGFLSRLFAYNKPLGLAARLVFEQSYSGVDGDSASSTELYAILSELSGIPVKQQYAVTGSVNQNGEVQAIGGVNEKIEGFFDVCKVKGFTGVQGVVIPESNAQNLMLREDIVEAVKAGEFHIVTVSTIAEGIEVLTGMKAGEKQLDGSFEKDTVYYKVDMRLTEMAEVLKQYPGYV
jgi:lon-related putative ATP-dependent protease